MSVKATTLRRLAELHLAPEQMAGVLGILAEMAEIEEEARAKEADRKRKDRERKSSGKFRGNSTESAGNFQEIPEENPGETLSLPLSPQTPQSPTHTRESITTRERMREDAAFARFWADYPRKTSKAEARKAFSKAWKKLPPHDEETVLSGGLERAKAGWTDAQFIPHAATWLNGERWNDEPPTPSTVTHLRPHERSAPSDKFAAKQANLARALAGADRAAGFRGKP